MYKECENPNCKRDRFFLVEEPGRINTIVANNAEMRRRTTIPKSSAINGQKIRLYLSLVER